MKQQTKGGALHRLWQALPWLWMAAAYLFDLWYQLVPGKWIVDSDLASEMILSDLLNKEGSIISHNWFYSTELKVVNLQWFYRLGLLLFPDDWHLARAFGMAVTLALYAACMLFFVKCARLGRPGLWMVGTLLWPFGQHYLVYAIYGGYYLVYTFFYMLVLALVLRSLDADKKHCALQWLAACIVTAIAGMNGVKQLMVFHAPLCIAAAILLVLALHDSGTSDWKTALQHCRRQVRLFAASLVTAVAGAAGYFISNSVMSRLYDFKSYSFIVWDRDENWFTLDRILMDFFHEFGYQNGSGIFHFGGIAAGIGLLLGGWMFFCIVRLLLRLKKLETNDQLLVLLLVAMLGKRDQWLHHASRIESGEMKGEVEAGFVYMTDAKIAEAQVTVAAEVSGHAPVTYPIAVTAASARKDAAKAFVAYVLSEPGQAILAKYGFKKP